MEAARQRCKVAVLMTLAIHAFSSRKWFVFVSGNGHNAPPTEGARKAQIAVSAGGEGPTSEYKCRVPAEAQAWELQRLRRCQA